MKKAAAEDSVFKLTQGAVSLRALAWRCRKMELAVREAAAEDSGSAIRQAFLAALQKELGSLYQLMAQLDTLAGHPLPAGDAGMMLHIRLLSLIPASCIIVGSPM